MKNDLLSIGAFADATRLSHKALRFYHERGLLVPHHIDPDTGYRWYRPNQVQTARLIAMLRAAEVPLAPIACVIAEPHTDARAAMIDDILVDRDRPRRICR